MVSPVTAYAPIGTGYVYSKVPHASRVKFYAHNPTPPLQYRKKNPHVCRLKIDCKNCPFNSPNCVCKCRVPLLSKKTNNVTPEYLQDHNQRDFTTLNYLHLAT